MAQLARLSPTNWLNLSLFLLEKSIYLDRRCYLRGGTNCLHTMEFEVIDTEVIACFAKVQPSKEGFKEYCEEEWVECVPLYDSVQDGDWRGGAKIFTFNECDQVGIDVGSYKYCIYEEDKGLNDCKYS